MAGILIMSFGTAFMSPVIQTSIRRFTPLKARSTGFNIYYLLMNISAVIANVFLIEFFRKHFGRRGRRVLDHQLRNADGAAGLHHHPFY